MNTVPLRGNRLLAALPAEEFTHLAPHLKSVDLHADQVLVRPGDEMKYGYFPLDGVISLLMILEDGMPVEVANIGNEGFADSSSILSVATSTYEVTAQGPVSAFRIPVSDLRKEFRENSGLRELLLRFCGVVLTCTGRSLACKVTHSAEQRLAKWLLLARDRTNSNQLPYTQETLSRMLGVQRQTVSLAAEHLKNEQLIDYRHGKIYIVDRDGLQKISCEDYQAFIDAYQTLLGPLPAHENGFLSKQDVPVLK